MKQRCLNPNCPTYNDYGGRGISICDDWVKDFMKFREWALACGYEDNAERGTYTVERINNDFKSIIFIMLCCLYSIYYIVCVWSNKRQEKEWNTKTGLDWIDWTKCM